MKVITVTGPDISAAETVSPDEGDCSEADPESGLSAPAEQDSGLALEQAASFVKDSFQAFAQFFVERFADLHGVGVLYRVVKWGYGVIEWARVAEDGGGVDVQAPLPLWPADVLSVSVHLGGDPDAAPVSFFIAPSGESGVGAVALGPLEIDPAPGSADGDGDGLQHMQETPWPVKIVPVQLSQALANPGLRRASGSLDAVMAAAAARRLAEQELLPGLLEWRQLLLDAGVDLVLGYDAALGIAVWVDLSDADRPSGPVVVQAVEDQLQIGVRPGAVDLVVRSEPVTGSEVWLHLMNAERRSPPVVIRCDPTSRLEVAVAPDAGMESSERVALTGHTILPVPEGFQVEHPTNGGTGNPAGIYVGQTARLISKRAAGTAAEMPAIRLTRLVPVPVASVWRDLAQWLFQNGSLLSEITGIEIELKSREYNVGQLSVDMSGRDKSTGNLVIIKSQYGPASNEHLEQILSYAKATRPVTIIWVAEEFPEQHQVTLDRLNAQTDAASSFFGIRLDAVTLAGAPADLIAPRLELVVKPDQNDKQS